MGLQLSDPVERLTGVGKRRAGFYQKLGITTIASLISFYPRAYLDLSLPVDIADTLQDENNVICATVLKKQGRQTLRSGLSLFKVSVGDDSGALQITIFNSEYLFDSLKLNEKYYFYGKVTGDILKKEMTSPLCLDGNETGLIRPIYSLTEGLSNKSVQTNVTEALSVWGDCLSDILPDEIRQRNELCLLRYALENIHFPADNEALAVAKKRLIFEELFILQLGLLKLRQSKRSETAYVFSDISVEEFYKALPFKLTNGQTGAINEALSDTQRSTPMNRLLQGDVGSGKTAVAAALCYAAAKNGFQSAVMAPTQILAQQHYKTLTALCADEPLNMRICLLTGGLTLSQRKALCADIEQGEYDIVVGTHALVSDSVSFKALGLVVTDEQHRFGVAQRAKIAQKGDNPHILIMSATPIPRTLALLIYGDLDVSVIRELPKGRQPIETMVIDSKKRGRALGFVKKQLDAGRQGYIVCPLIDNSDNPQSELVSTAAYIKALMATPLAKYELAALNGKQKAKEKDDIMADFADNKIQLLISTTVIEVGVDVPNANIIMIENAERFGLSQLHQLRGRVGRGTDKSYCVLVSDNEGEENKRRLEVMKNTSDGFVIAEEDLKLRGPGDFFGFRQHGLPALKLANYYDDIEVLKETKKQAGELMQGDPKLKKAEHQGLLKSVEELFEQNGQPAMN